MLRVRVLIQNHTKVSPSDPHSLSSQQHFLTGVALLPRVLSENVRERWKQGSREGGGGVRMQSVMTKALLSFW